MKLQQIIKSIAQLYIPFWPENLLWDWDSSELWNPYKIILYHIHKNKMTCIDWISPTVVTTCTPHLLFSCQVKSFKKSPLYKSLVVLGLIDCRPGVKTISLMFDFIELTKRKLDKKIFNALVNIDSKSTVTFFNSIAIKWYVELFMKIHFLFTFALIYT